MASYRLNIARIRDCPPPKELAQAMQELALPEEEPFGVLNCTATDETCLATIIRRTQQAIQKLQPKTREITTAAVEKVTVYPLAVRPDRDILEIYAGAVSAIDQIGEFFASSLALPTLVEAIELDIPATIEKLASNVQKFQLRSIRISEYAHNSYMSGPYAPKFLDSQHGMDFLQEYVDYVKSATVRFQGPSGRINVTLTAKACFSFSCNEEDQPTAQATLRNIL